MFNGPKCSYRVCTRAKTTSTSIPSLNLSPPLSVLPLLPHRPLSEKSRTPRKVGSFCRRHGPKPDSQYQVGRGKVGRNPVWTDSQSVQVQGHIGFQWCSLYRVVSPGPTCPSRNVACYASRPRLSGYVHVRCVFLTWDRDNYDRARARASQW